MNNIILIYSPFANDSDAERVGRKLLEEGLVACVNLIPGGRSLYWWDSKIETSAETYALLKTTSLLARKAIARLEDLHPYDTPCIVTLEPESVNAQYIQWLKSSIFVQGSQK